MFKKDLRYQIDVADERNGFMEIYGWAASADPQDVVSVSLVNEFGKEYPDAQIERVARFDVSQALYSEVVQQDFGFVVSFVFQSNNSYYLFFKNKHSQKRVHVSGGLMRNREMRYRMIDMWNYLKGGNFKAFFSRNVTDYESWYERYVPKRKDYERQRKENLQGPKISIVVPLYKTPEKFLKDLMDCVKAQTYSNWELCFADGSPDESLADLVRKYKKDDARIQYRFIGENKGISGNTNEAVKMASGEFVAFCDHDDLITQNALYEFAKVFVADPECDAIYSDEDKTDGSKFFEPHFKPDYSVDFLATNNYICHFFAVRKELIEKYGDFNSAYDGAQDMEFIIRMCEHARHVVHVPKILYHWRMSANSTATNPQAKMYAFEAGKRAARDYYERKWPQFPVERVEDGPSLGIYHCVFRFDEEPLISVIIPNKDHTEDLDKAIRSMLTKGTWQNLEFIVVENNSTEPETFAYYERIQKEFANVKVVRYEQKGFNFSAINNFGVSFAKGEYLLFLNNDVELIAPDSLKEMMGYCQRPDVGIVGCQLMYPDETIQHAGVILGLGGIANHAFQGQYAHSTYFNRALVVQDFSAVTAAVMLTKRSVFEQAGRFDEEFAVSYNDIDYCLRVRKMGLSVVYQPYAVFTHYESKSRGHITSGKKQDQFLHEHALFLHRWYDIVQYGDPFYNPNLTRHALDYSLRNFDTDPAGTPFYQEKEVKKIMQYRVH